MYHNSRLLSWSAERKLCFACLVQYAKHNALGKCVYLAGVFVSTFGHSENSVVIFRQFVRGSLVFTVT